MSRIGDKEAVYYGEAHHTPGGLTKQDLVVNSKGKIVSARQHAAGKAKVANLHRGKAAGGRFGFMRLPSVAIMGAMQAHRNHKL